MLWLTPLRVEYFLWLGLGNFLFYLFLLHACLSRILKVRDCDRGQSLGFIMVQMPLLFSLFLFLLVDLLLRHSICGR